MNQRPTDVDDMKGSEVTDRDGDKLGKLEAVYLDRRTDEPAWGLVNLSGLRSGRRFVLLRSAHHGEGALRIDASETSTTKMITAAITFGSTVRRSLAPLGG